MPVWLWGRNSITALMAKLGRSDKVAFPCRAMSLKLILHSLHRCAALLSGLFHVTWLQGQCGCDSRGVPSTLCPQGQGSSIANPCRQFPHTVSLWCKHSWGKKRENPIFQPFVVAFTPTALSAFSAYTPERLITVFYVVQ